MNNPGKKTLFPLCLEVRKGKIMMLEMSITLYCGMLFTEEIMLRTVSS